MCIPFTNLFFIICFFFVFSLDFYWFFLFSQECFSLTAPCRFFSLVLFLPLIKKLSGFVAGRYQLIYQEMS